MIFYLASVSLKLSFQIQDQPKSPTKPLDLPYLTSLPFVCYRLMIGFPPDVITQKTSSRHHRKYIF